MVRCSSRQLALAFPGHQAVLEPTPGAATPARTVNAPAGRRAVRTIDAVPAVRTRAMPSRNSLGQFVSFPTVRAPSWYVFCAGGYRIPGELSPDALAPAMPQPLPRAVARRRRVARTRLSSADVLTYLVLIVGCIALLWYGLHLPRPHR
jgi:hypothetical protein